MKFEKWEIKFGAGLILSSVILYTIHYLIFHEAQQTAYYTFMDISFLPLNVLLVTFILHRLLNKQEKESRLKKMNMVIGVFFSELGHEMLARFQSFNPQAAEFGDRLVITSKWKREDFLSQIQHYKTAQPQVDFLMGDIQDMKEFLIDRRLFLLGLLENPNLLEHENFTDLLWAVFHLTEELARRKSLDSLPVSDREHLAGDIKRAYSVLVTEWLHYMLHLKENYPYLLSLELRSNPFDVNAKVEVG